LVDEGLEHVVLIQEIVRDEVAPADEDRPEEEQPEECDRGEVHHRRARGGKPLPEPP